MRLGLCLLGVRLLRVCLLCLRLRLRAGAAGRLCAKDALDHLFCRFGRACLLLLLGTCRCGLLCTGIGACKLFHHPLGIGLSGLGAGGSLTRSLTLLHDRLLLLLCFSHAYGAVEEIALSRIFQCFIGAADLGETRGGRGVALIVIGMHGLGHVAPGRLDFVRIRVALDAQNLIWITHCSHRRCRNPGGIFLVALPETESQLMTRLPVHDRKARSSADRAGELLITSYFRSWIWGVLPLMVSLSLNIEANRHAALTLKFQGGQRRKTGKGADQLSGWKLRSCQLPPPTRQVLP
jgi:hypothetical protein